MFSGLGLKTKPTTKKAFDPFAMSGSGNQQPNLTFQTNAPSMSQNQYSTDFNENSYRTEASQPSMGFGNINQLNPNPEEPQPQPKKGPSFGKFKGKQTTEQPVTIPTYGAESEEISTKYQTETTETSNFENRSEPIEYNNHEVPVFKKV
jgi:hypothetical protein